ncbi:hypothetical protein KDE13_08420 [Campylobacter sp. faydin G-140]|uniref:hypothetical protein n=1 Tax=Campylobacter anatolicus TaxID=2829105 RepID=UPI001B94B0F0|nr:hypothetical protein [Campylobacter anatolicus]MBR8466356.1 hypothetical protein [Campylobacter anatolicus]
MTQTVVNSDIDVLIDALRSLGGGAFLSETSKNLKTAINSVVQTEKSANITLKLTIKPDQHEKGQIVVFGSNSVILPKEPIKTRFYVSKEMLPSRNAPDQLVFDFKK